jgi:hypothetical protein
MDSQETPINRKERRRSRRSRAAEKASSWLDEWVFIRGGDLVRGIFALLSRAFETISWALRRYLVWPLQDRLGGLGAPGRVLAAIAAALVLGVGVAAVLSVSSGGEDSEPTATEVAVVAEEPTATPAPKPVAPEPVEETLQGAAPVFKATKDEQKSSGVEGASEPIASAPAGADPATTRIGSKPGAATSSLASPAGGQSAVGIDGPPAGAEALAVAEDFAGAFVLYETGGKKKKVRKAFAATATPELAKALLDRPPRQPANVKVPDAKVVNVVAGPSHGGVYSVSVSLLRVGLTSELRLDMEKHKDEWLVTNVLG